MMIFADVWGRSIPQKNAQWHIILRLIPWVMPGIALGAIVLHMIPSKQMAPFMGGLLIVMIALQVAQQRRAKWVGKHVPHQLWFSAVAGVLVGFLTMAGNVAGAVMGIYLLSMGLQKKKFMGTCAWYFLIVNLIKVPIQVGMGYIIGTTLLFDLKMAPMVLLGAGLGVLLFRKIPEKWFTSAILALATIAALRMLFL